MTSNLTSFLALQQVGKDYKGPSMKIFLDSRTANIITNGQGITYQFTLTSPITILKYIRLVSSLIPNVHYNIDVQNNYLNYTLTGSGTYTLQITPGNYTATQLASQIQSLLNAQTTNWTVNYNTNTSLFTFSNTATFQLLFSSGANASNSIWSLTGFTQNVDTTLATSATATNIGDLNSPSYALIDIKNLNPMPLKATQGLYDTKFIQTFISPKGTIETFPENSNFWQQIELLETNNINKLDIGLYTKVINQNGSTNLNLYNLPFILVFEFL